jgi:hypothetical protein
MIDDLLTQFRDDVPLPDDATTQRIFVRATTSRSARVSPRQLAFALVLVAAATLALVPIGGASLGARAARDINRLWQPPPPNQSALDRAADDAARIASGYYTDASVNDPANKVDLHLSHAPQSVIDALNAAHPGIYAIDNDAAHTFGELRRVQHSLDLGPLKTRAGYVRVFESYPTPDGHLRVGIGGHTRLQAAQAALDAKYGPGIIKVFGGAQREDGLIYH